MTSILFRIGRICRSLFKPNYLKNEKRFLNFLESASNFKHSQEKEIAITNVFLKLQTLKDLVSAISKKCCFRTSSESQDVKGSQLFLKSA